MAGVASVCLPTNWAGPSPSRKSLNWLLAPRFTPEKIKLTQRTHKHERMKTDTTHQHQHEDRGDSLEDNNRITLLSVTVHSQHTLILQSLFCCLQENPFTASHYLQHEKHFWKWPEWDNPSQKTPGLNLIQSNFVFYHRLTERCFCSALIMLHSVYCQVTWHIHAEMAACAWIIPQNMLVVQTLLPHPRHFINGALVWWDDS